MLGSMRTTLEIDGDTLRAVERYAAESGRTLSSVVDSALRGPLARAGRKGRPYKLRWVIVHGRAQPGVDLTHRGDLLDRMEEHS